MYRIHKTVVISAAHSLSSLPPEHKCHNLHGHNYKIEVEIEGERLDEHGMLVDFGLLADIVKRYDHKDLNDLLKPTPTTAENFAQLLRESLCIEIGSSHPGLTVRRVRVWETDDSWAEVDNCWAGAT